MVSFLRREMKRSTSKGLSASPVAVVLVVWWFVFSPASFLRREMKRSTSKVLSASPVAVVLVV